jgi:uncharacterized protein YwqG
MNRETILEVLDEAGYAEHANAVAALIRPAIFIRGKKLAGRPSASAAGGDTDSAFEQAAEALPLGASRFGGIPDLPAGAGWPARDDVPMEFVAQLRLADVAPHDQSGLLPASGSLLFFYNSQWTTFDQDEDHACCAVIFHDGPDSALVRTPPPRVEFQDEFSPAPRLAPRVHGLAALSFEPVEAVPGGAGPWIGEDSPLHDLWPDLQADFGPRLCPTTDGPSRQNHLLGYIDGEDYVGAHANGCDDQLLLQLDSDSSADFQWGDCDRLYFVLRREELLARDFSRARVYSILG